MKLALIFTNDWELFGDGSGDYYEIQHQPLVELTSLMNDYGAKLTIMAEVFQQLKHIEFTDKNKSFKSITDSWEKVLQDSYLSGHDIQLHLHPQWNEAKYINNEWLLGDNWSIGKRPKAQIEKFITDGKLYLENVIRKVDEDYQCNCFRAGAYYIEPSTNVIEELSLNNFVCDTSVTKGTYVDSYYDYRKAYSNILPWGIGTEGVTKKSNEPKMMEIPIYSAISIDSEAFKKFVPNLYYKLRFGVSPSNSELQWMKQRDTIKSIRYPSSRRAYKKHENKNLSWYINKILSKNAIQLDYDYVPASIFVKMLENIFNDKSLKKYRSSDIVIPIVAIGHVKDMHNTDNVKGILEGIDKKLKDKVVYLKLSEAVESAKLNLI